MFIATCTAALRRRGPPDHLPSAASEREVAAGQRQSGIEVSNGTSTKRWLVTCSCGSRADRTSYFEDHRASADPRRSHAACGAAKPATRPTLLRRFHLPCRRRADRATMGGSDLDAGVEKLRLVEDQADRLAVIRGGGAQNVDTVTRQRIDGRLQVRAAVADVDPRPRKASTRPRARLRPTPRPP